MHIVLAMGSLPLPMAYWTSKEIVFLPGQRLSSSLYEFFFFHHLLFPGICFVYRVEWVGFSPLLLFSSRSCGRV